MNAYLDGFRRAFDFSGRSTRREFWLFVLFGTLAVIVASLIDVLVLRETGTTWLATLVSLVQIVPSLSVGIRRLHDAGRSGWWYLISLVPFVGWIVLVVMLCGRSVPAGPGTSKPQRPRRRYSAERAAAGAGLGVMIAEAGEVAGAASELVTADADDSPDDDGADGDSDFDMD